jgi:hypothetical protein
MSDPRSGGPELRIGDAEREAAVAALGEHYAAGRLTKEEFDDRSDRAYAARTRSALWPLFADLPPSGSPVNGPRPRQAPSAGGRPGGRPGEWSGQWSGGVPRRSGPPWWVGGIMPVLLVVIGLSVLTHLPFILLVFIGWLLFSKVLRLWRFGGGHGPWQHPRGGHRPR